MSVSISDLSGKQYEVNLALHDTVHTLKERLKAIHGVSLLDKDLYFQNMALMDSSALSSIGISAGSKLLISQAINHQTPAQTGATNAGYPSLQKRQSINSVQYQPAHQTASATPPAANRPRLNLDKTSQHNVGVLPQQSLQYAMMGNPSPLPVGVGLPLQMVPVVPFPAGLGMMGVQMPVIVNPAALSAGGIVPISPIHGQQAHQQISSSNVNQSHSGSANPFDDVEKVLSRKKASHPIPDHLFESTVPLDKEKEYLDEVKRKLDRSKTVPIKIKAERSQHSNDSTDMNTPTTPRQPQQSSRGPSPSPRHSFTTNSASTAAIQDAVAHSQSHSMSLSAQSMFGLQPNSSGHHSPSSSPRPLSKETPNSATGSFSSSLTSSASSASTSTSSLPPLLVRPSSLQLMSSSGSTQYRRIVELESERKELDERLHKHEDDQQEKLKQLQSFITQIESERSVSLALLQSQKLKFDANFESLKEKLKEEEEKTAKTLGPMKEQIKELEEKINGAQKKLQASKESEDEQRKKCQENIQNLRRTLGGLSSGRDAVEYDQEKRKKELATTIGALLQDSGIEDEVWKELNERRQRRVAEIIARTTGAAFGSTPAPSCKV